METPSRHSFDLNGSLRVFPIPSPIKGDNYCRLEVDGVIVNDRTKYDIVNNSVVFLNVADVPNGSQLDVLVVQSEEAIGQLSITTNIDIVATNISDINTVAANIAGVSTVNTNIASVNTVAGNTANVNLTAGSIGNVNLTGGSIGNVNTTANSIANVNTVATNIATVNAVAGNNANVTAVAGNATNINAAVANAGNINAVVANATNINTVATNNANVTKVGNIDTQVTTVANNDANVTTVAGISGNVTTVAGISGNVTTVATNNTNVTAVANNSANINAAVANSGNINAAVANTSNINAAVANATNINDAVSNEANINAAVGNEANITAVVNNATNINAVVANTTNINTVAGINTDVTTVASNIAAILDAPSQASDAAASAVSAASSASSAAALLDNFDDRYLGAKASDVSVDNDGNALIVGALYYNTTDGVMKVYTASGWIAASSASVATLATYEFVATAGQTVFTGVDAEGQTLSYTAPALIVSLNGVRLRPGDDYTATDGVNLTLVSAATVGDELVVDAFGNFLVADTYSKAQVDSLLSGVDATALKDSLGNTVVDASSGNVGIGTASPATQLVLAGNNSLLAENNTLRFWDTDNATQTNQQLGKIEFYSSDATAPGPSVKAYMGAFADDSSPGVYMAFATDAETGTAIEAMRITSAGNVGIKTSSPAAPLDVAGKGFFRGAGSFEALELITSDVNRVYITGNSSVSGDMWRVGTSNSNPHLYIDALQSNGDILLRTGGANERVRIDDAGNVGINTSAPASKLHIKADSNSETDYPLTIENLANSLDLGIGAYGFSNTIGVSQGSDFKYNVGRDHIFQSDSVERMRIAEAGSVGIGTSSPTNGKLEVTHSSSTVPAGFFRNTSGSGDSPSLTVQGGANNAAPNFSVLDYSGNVDFVVQGTGNLQFNSGYGSAATAYGCRVWVNFNGGGAITIRGSGNVSSITDNGGVGDYTINFTTSLPDSNYCPVFGGEGGFDVQRYITDVSKNTGTYGIRTGYQTSGGSFAQADIGTIQVAIFR